MVDVLPGTLTMIIEPPLVDAGSDTPTRTKSTLAINFVVMVDASAFDFSSGSGHTD
jgi:hypothetical protein